ISSLELPNDQAGNSQDGLIQAVAATGVPTIVVLNAGGPVLMPWINSVAGVLDAWYPGEEDGNAIAALLFGDVNPSGHLPETFPLSMNDLPTAGNPAQYPGVTVPGDSVGPEVTYSEGLNVGYRWYDDTGKQVLFPFGYGLSYTTFKYSNYALTPGTSPGTANVSFTVTNTGSVAGATVAQVYVGSPANNYVDEPLHQLRAFQKTDVLQPGAHQDITLTLDSKSVSYWNTDSSSWQPENGCHPVWVGGSSRDIELQGSGLNGDMSLASDCAASLSTYVFSNGQQVPESPSGALLLLVPTSLAVGVAIVRRRRRGADTV
ncbi:MAG: glycoside hydrolase family 3 C-terminal domain-containing protein, partial [Candidatus Dormibacteraeota bacterium]|nr:glycoside hydrolase family 3 C-terminal domain-containing protein [Candidatus Dormibacteraeota bacterium]